MRYSFRKHKSNDYIVVLCFIFPIVFWCILFYDIATSVQTFNEKSLSIIINSVLTVIALVLITLRIYRMKSLCETGKSINGYVYKLNSRRDRGHMICIYKYDNVEYKKKFAFHRTKNSKQINVNDDITLIVDPNSPKNSYIRSFIDRDFNHGE